MTGEQHSVKADTDYIVLAGQGLAWQEIGLFTARDANAAVKKAAAETLEGDDQALSFVAVPSRSFNPVKVAVKIERSIVLEEARS